MSIHVPDRRGLCGIGLALLAGGVCFASPVIIRHDRTDADARRLAEPYDMTCRVSRDGTGTLIAPTWIATAAHVARAVSPFDQVVRFGDQEYPIARIVIHPEAKDMRHGMAPSSDIALIELTRPVEGVTAMPLYRHDDEEGRSVVVVGYGDYGVANGPLNPMDGHRRAVTNIVAEVDEKKVTIVFDAPPDGTGMEGIGGPGDSGGPLVVLVDDQPLLMGVSSYADGDPDDAYGRTDVYMRVSTFADWIDATIADPPATSIPLDRVRDIAQHPLPKSDAATCLQDLIAALNGAGLDAIAEFSRTYRGDRARAERDDQQWARLVRRRAGTRGELTVRKWMPRSEGGFVVQVHDDRDGSHGTIVVGFDENAGRLLGVDVQFP